MTTFFEVDQNLWITSWRAASLESVRDELATALGLSFEPQGGAYVASSLAGELRLDARPARTCAQQVFILRTQGVGGSHQRSEALAAHLRSLGHEWYRPYEYEEEWRTDQLDDLFSDRELSALIFAPRWLAWIPEDERDDAEGVAYDLSRAWHQNAKRDPAYLWARFAELDAQWCRVPRQERLGVLKAARAVEELKSIGPELDEIDAWLKTGRAALPGTKRNLDDLRKTLAANPEPAAVPLRERVEDLLAKLQRTLTVTILAVPTERDFESMTDEERRRESGGWINYPVRSGRRLPAFLAAGTTTDLDAWLAEDRDGELAEGVETRVIHKSSVAAVLARLEALIANAEPTAAALCAYGGNSSDVARVTAALQTDGWPTSGDPAEEAAAFALHLRDYLRIAKDERIGVCW